MVTEFFWLVGIQEMGIPEAINHAIEQLPIGKWFICTECCGCTMQSSSKTAFTCQYVATESFITKLFP